MSRDWNDYISTGATAVVADGRALSAHLGKNHLWNNIIVANNANRTIFSFYLNQTVTWSGGYLGTGHTKLIQATLAIPAHYDQGEIKHHLGICVASKAASGSPPSDGCRLDVYTQTGDEEQNLLFSYTLSNSSTANYVNIPVSEFHPELVNIDGNYMYIADIIIDAVLKASGGYTYTIGVISVFYASEDELE